MVVLILTIVCGMPPQSPMPPQCPVSCHEEMNVRSPKPMGDGWQWDEREGVWWRDAGFAVASTPQPTRSSTGTIIRRGFRLIGNGGMRQSGSIPFLSGGQCGPRG